MMRPTDRETIPVEKIVCCSSQEEGARHTMQGHTGSPRIGQEAKEWGESMGKSPYCNFPGKEWVRQGKQATRV